MPVTVFFVQHARSWAENEFFKKNMEDLKNWKTQSAMHKVAFVLIIDGINFSYTEEDGITFSAPDFYVEKLKRRLVTCYGCSLDPVIVETNV